MLIILGSVTIFNFSTDFDYISTLVSDSLFWAITALADYGFCS